MSKRKKSITIQKPQISLEETKERRDRAKERYDIKYSGNYGKEAKKIELKRISYEEKKSEAEKDIKKKEQAVYSKTTIGKTEANVSKVIAGASRFVGRYTRRKLSKPKRVLRSKQLHVNIPVTMGRNAPYIPTFMGHEIEEEKRSMFFS